MRIEQNKSKFIVENSGCHYDHSDKNAFCKLCNKIDKRNTYSVE